MSRNFPELSSLLSCNAQWATDVAKAEPGFFAASAKGQSPKVLWFGCADSRVPESVIMGCRPGDIFVHRNIANQFHLDDDSAQAVLTYAVEHLGVEHVVVVGHTQCGGAAGAFAASCAALKEQSNGKSGSNAESSASTPLNRWLAPLIALATSLHISTLPTAEAVSILVDDSVKRQVDNVCRSEVITKAWAGVPKRKPVYVHGWVYELETGRLRDLGVSRGPQ